MRLHYNHSICFSKSGRIRFDYFHARVTAAYSTSIEGCTACKILIFVDSSACLFVHIVILKVHTVPGIAGVINHAVNNCFECFKFLAKGMSKLCFSVFNFIKPCPLKPFNFKEIYIPFLCFKAFVNPALSC